ncbi:MAG: hypothetical protein H7123_04535 [Thermoleophilia bacterium]|nr:hypothetical protein [Thermoleophilia bacterium]
MTMPVAPTNLPFHATPGLVSTGSIPAAPAAPERAAPTQSTGVPFLQDRTDAQLKDGLVVNVKGVGAGDFAAARLIQDGASFIAKQAGTTLGLVDVTINDSSADSQGALGLATFNGNKGWFGLSKRSTAGVMEGIARLHATPWDKWTESQRQDFIQANETILHESGHVTLPAYDNPNINAWHGAARSFEEGLTEVVTMAHMRDFMKAEFGVDVGDLTNRITQSTSAYTRYTERITRMIGMGTDGSPAAIANAASLIADGTRADHRFDVIAQRIAANLGGPNAPKVIIDEIARTLEGFIDEKNGTRTRLMQLQGALVDGAAGKQVDIAALLKSVHALTAKHPDSQVHGPVNGTKPLD